MIHDRRSALAKYVNGLLSAGRTVFTAEEAEQALGIGRGLNSASTSTSLSGPNSS